MRQTLISWGKTLPRCQAKKRSQTSKRRCQLFRKRSTDSSWTAKRNFWAISRVVMTGPRRKGRILLPQRHLSSVWIHLGSSHAIKRVILVCRRWSTASRKGQVLGKKPCARDGHASLVHEEFMIVFGGDRHMVSFNDAYLFKLDKGVESLPHYEWSIPSLDKHNRSITWHLPPLKWQPWPWLKLVKSNRSVSFCWWSPQLSHSYNAKQGFHLSLPSLPTASTSSELSLFSPTLTWSYLSCLVPSSCCYLHGGRFLSFARVGSQRTWTAGSLLKDLEWRSSSSFPEISCIRDSSCRLRWSCFCLALRVICVMCLRFLLKIPWVALILSVWPCPAQTDYTSSVSPNNPKRVLSLRIPSPLVNVPLLPDRMKICRISRSSCSAAPVYQVGWI